MDGICNAGTIKFISGVLNLGPVDASANGKGIKLEYGFLPVKALTSEEIERSPDKFNIKNLVTSMSPDVKVSEDGELMFRGARKGDMVYMMDGMKSNEVSTVPSCAIGRVMVYTGGLPAKYGDTLGGVVVMETKGYFDLYRQWEATEIKTGKK
jgi:outer membrane receptor protein involved in Fe transport